MQKFFSITKIINMFSTNKEDKYTQTYNKTRKQTYISLSVDSPKSSSRLSTIPEYEIYLPKSLMAI